MPGPSSPQRRYAVYFAPPRGSALDRFGRTWLGRDAWTGAEVAQPEIDGIDAARLAALTAAPRRYGFHATLVAPFALADGETEARLADAVAAFAAGRDPVEADGLRFSDLRGFLALTLAGPTASVDSLANACVESFRSLAESLPPADRRRREAGLSPRQARNLARWNYPYVFEDYRFHMTLTGPVDDDAERSRIEEGLAEPLAGILAEPLVIDALTLFVEDGPGADFHVAGRFPFGEAAASY